MSYKLSEEIRRRAEAHAASFGRPERIRFMETDRWADEVAVLEDELEAMEEQRYVVWEGDESEGRWRCLMCGEKREGEDDTGPEGVEHVGNCGHVGTAVWIYAKLVLLESVAGAAQEMLDSGGDDLDLRLALEEQPK